MHLFKKLISYVDIRKSGKEEFSMKLFTMLTIKLLTAFLVYSIFAKNFEFIYYNAILLPTIIIIYLLHKELRLHLPIFILLCTALFLHVIGGSVAFAGTRLYDLNFWFIGYDNIVHFISIFTIVFVCYNLIVPYLKESTRKYNLYLGLILILMAMGFGAVIELVELFAVVFLDAAEGVGGYMNNAVDLFVNLIGAITGTFLVVHYHRNRSFRDIFLGGKLFKIFRRK